MPTSAEWLRYFQENARSLLDVPWDLGPELTADEKAAVAESLREFQAGESSEGRHLFKYAQAYGEATGDREYVEAIRLFIAEEQRHGRDLGRFLTLHGIPLVRTTFTDRVFRRLRNVIPSLEISVAVLVTAEIFAEVYYAALRDATESQLLRRLCDQILRDEVKHVEFQTGQLTRLRSGRSRALAAVTTGLQRFLFFGTILVVWPLHRPVFRRGGLSFVGYWCSCWRYFGVAFPSRTVRPAVAPGLEPGRAV